MTPAEIVGAAIRKKLAMIAICDHNSTGNVAAVQEAAAGTVAVLPGMELTTAEEVHVLGLFPDAESSCAANREVRTTLPDVGQVSGKLGEQPLMTASGQILQTETKMLAAATSFGLSETIDLIRHHHGLAIAAHVDRPTFSVLSQLGMFPVDVQFDALEFTMKGVLAAQAVKLIRLEIPVISSSDAHFLADIGSASTTLMMARPDFDELALALEGESGRRVCHDRPIAPHP